MMQSNLDKIDFYFKVLARYDQYVQLANTKASNHITLLSSILVAITALVGWGVSFNNFDCFTAIILILYLIFLLFSLRWYTSCMAVIEPNRMRNTNNSGAQSESELSTIFYSDVAKFLSFNSFKSQINIKNENDQLEDLIHQVYIMAKVTERKFEDFQKVNTIVVATVFCSILILFLTCVYKING